MNTFPADCWRLIFQKLPKYIQLLCRLVCKRWNVIINYKLDMKFQLDDKYTATHALEHIDFKIYKYYTDYWSNDHPFSHHFDYIFNNWNNRYEEFLDYIYPKIQQFTVNKTYGLINKVIYNDNVLLAQWLISKSIWKYRILYLGGLEYETLFVSQLYQRYYSDKTSKLLDYLIEIDSYIELSYKKIEI
jgi:hypothetical protein